jgi:DNA-binding transcriptional MerR regulator
MNEDPRIMAHIPDKLYFRIGEVSRITGIEPYVLRYWETEFDGIKPLRSNNQRLYRRQDVELILKIKNMLREEGHTIAGAKRKIKERVPQQLTMGLSEQAYRQLLREIRDDLRELKKILDSPKR